MTKRFLFAIGLMLMAATTGCFADQGEEALMTEGAKIFQTLQSKCQSKPIPVSKALATVSNCAEPVLKNAGNIIPSTLYPTKYKMILDTCFGKLNPSANMCDRAMLEQIKKCTMQKGFSALPILKTAYAQHKPQVLELVRDLINACVPKIQDL